MINMMDGIRHNRGGYRGGGGGWGLQPPLLSKFLIFARSFRGFWGSQPPLLSKNLVFRTHADSTGPPPPPPLVELAESGQHPPARSIGRKQTAPPPLVESAESRQHTHTHPPPPPPPPPPLVLLLINNPPLSEILYPPLHNHLNDYIADFSQCPSPQYEK